MPEDTSTRVQAIISPDLWEARRVLLRDARALTRAERGHRAGPGRGSQRPAAQRTAAGQLGQCGRSSRPAGCYARPVATVPEAQRAAALQRLTLSPALREMALGLYLPPLFEFRVQRVTKLYVAGDRPLIGAGPAEIPVVPLWESGTTVLAVRQEADYLVFFTFSLEDPACRAQDLAQTEQGLWAALFVEAYEDEHSDEALEVTAAEVGFRYWPLVLARYHAASQKTFQESEAFRHALTVEIDVLEGTHSK